MARLLADENFPRASVEALRSLGHDVSTVREAGLANRGTTDAAILAWAASESRAVITYDRRDYLRLHSNGAPHAGIVACTEDRDYMALAARIHEALLRSPEIAGHVIRVNRPNLTTGGDTGARAPRGSGSEK